MLCSMTGRKIKRKNFDAFRVPFIKGPGPAFVMRMPKLRVRTV